MGWLIDNMNALETYQNNDNVRQRQIREDAYSDEQRARTRKAQLNEDSTKAEEARMMTDQLKSLETDTGAFNPADKLGVKKAAPVDGAPAIPVAPVEAAAPTYADGIKRDHLNAAKFSSLRGNTAGFQSAVAGFRKARMSEDGAKISSYVMNAPEEELSQLMAKITTNPQNSYDAVFDKASGFTTLKLGDRSVQMNRAQLGQYFSAKHRLSQGDDTALSAIADIDKDLAARVASDLNILSGVAGVNNKVNHDGRTLDMAQKKLEQDAKQHAQTLAQSAAHAAGRTGPAADGPQPPPSFDINKVAQKRWEELSKAQEDPSFTGEKRSAQNLQKQAIQEATSMRSAVHDSFKKDQQDSVIHQIMAPSRNSAMDSASQEYADLYLKLQQAKGQVIPRAYLESIGYPYPKLWERPARSR